jgi:hypothetical protein
MSQSCVSQSCVSQSDENCWISRTQALYEVFRVRGGILMFVPRPFWAWKMLFLVNEQYDYETWYITTIAH